MNARFPVASNAAAWEYLPEATEGQGELLPSWARILARSLPRTVAAMLELDRDSTYGEYARSSITRKIRWVAARANGCAYSETYAHTT